MSGMFSNDAAKRKQSQTALEAAGKGEAVKSNRVRINITMTKEEHEAIKRYAYERGANVSGIIQLWIRQNCK